MAEEKLLTIRDVSLILGISEKKVIDLAESGAIPAYKVGGMYLRFKRQQVEEAKKNLRHLAHKDVIDSKYSLKDKIGDFFYFNDFYIYSCLIIAVILAVIFFSY